MKKMMKLGTGIGMVLCLGGGVALAHDGEHHQGMAVHGTVSAVSGDRLTVKTGDGDQVFALLPDTKIEVAGKAAGRERLRQGDAVSVVSAKLPGGKIAAAEVMVGDGEGASHAAGNHTAGSHAGGTGDHGHK